MSLFQRPIQPPAILSDQAVERYLAAVRAELSVDPLFRRRLRGAVVNRFVAERESQGAASGRSRRMGALGRSVLYATFALSVSVSTAMAASQGAAPGDSLYPLKLQIEHLRLQALPEHFHDDLAAHSLGERIHELDVLADRGDWERVTRHAALVEAEYVAYVHAVESDPASVGRHLVVLGALVDRLPARAKLAVSAVVAGVTSAREKAVQEQGNSHGGGGSAGGNGQVGGPSGGSNGQGGGSASGGADSRPTPKPEPTPELTKSPHAEPAPKATKSPKATPNPPNPPYPPGNPGSGD